VPAVAAAVAGAMAGDSLGYEIGRRYGPAVRTSSLGRRISDDKWERSERYLRTRGGAAVFFARFLTGPKAIVPALAGESRMPYGRFLAWNATGAVVWGSFHVGIGYVAGSSWRIVHDYVTVGGYVLLGVVVVAAVTYLFVRRARKQRSHHRS
jgi:membrane protein DedA with SNARE-associated domain